MAELGLAEYFGIGETIGIITTLFVIFYYSRKQMKSLLVDLETKVLNDLDEKIHGMAEMLARNTELVKLLDKSEEVTSEKLVFAYYFLYMCAHAFHMRQRKVV